MKFVFLVLPFVAAAVTGRPQTQKEPVPIISLENNVNFDGTYNYAYEGGDGTKVQQSGQLKVVGPEPDKAGEVSQGSFTYIGEDGKTYSVSYTADEKGYVPIGEHLPTAPPVPEAIGKAVAYLLSLPPKSDKNE
ncbi:endocuticle structural glycoprotein SgAbd-3 [Cryptotermes secundus]|uniref:endocuticle structural glycoprotein SgAbd-3 n=1 Tax=Cryptotermes secundus TaxID=105785 RepID=UPI000CD7B409|nr:endocuticle structural glycoprotein SgAbd-3 [Cryptotermes secundus]